DGKTFEFGPLTKGQKIMKVVGDRPPTTPANEWKVEGTSVPKVEGRAIVTGAHQYASDVRRPGMLFGKVLRPAGVKATLAKLETSEAQAIPGVTVVREGDFVGVTAPTSQIAGEAVAALKAEWKTVPQPSDKELFKHLKEHVGRGGGGGGFGGRGGGGSATAG